MSLWGGSRVDEFPVRANLDTYPAPVFHTDSTPLCSCNHSRDETLFVLCFANPTNEVERKTDSLNLTLQLKIRF